MTSANYLGFITFLSLTLLACGGDPGGDTGETGGTTADAPPDTTGEVPTSSDATADPSTTQADTTGGETAGEATTDDATTDDATTDDVTTGGGIADCGFDPGVVFERTAAVFQLVSADGETCVWLERHDDSERGMIYKAIPYSLLQFKAGHAGAVEHLTDEAKLSWESTHHNWDDVAEAWTDTVRYRLEDWFAKDGAFENKFGLSAYDEQTDALLWGPVELVPFTP